MKNLVGKWQYANGNAGWTCTHVARHWRGTCNVKQTTPRYGKMNRSKQFASLVTLMVGVMAVQSVMAEEPEINPIRVRTRQINVYGTNPLQIHGTNVSVTAAQINAAGGGSTATITPTTATVGTALTASTLLTVSKKMVETPETVPATQGAVTITPTNSVLFVSGHYGVVTMSVAAATSPGQYVEIHNLIATNIVFVESTGLQLPAGYTAITNGQWDVLRLRAQSTNWNCIGWQDN